MELQNSTMPFVWVYCLYRINRLLIDAKMRVNIGFFDFIFAKLTLVGVF